VIYRFGEFELDDSRRELRKAGDRVDTEPKAFEMLLYLARHHDRAISKDELQEKIWPRTIVSETALTRCVMKARRAVDDDSSRQAVIRTVHSHGYQFVAELRSDTVPDAAPVQKTTPPPKSPRRRIDPRMAFGAALLVLAVAIGLITLREPAKATAQPPLAVLPVHNLVGDESLAWVRLGLMGLMKRMLADAGTRVASEYAVMQVVGDSDISGPPNDALMERLRVEADAGPALSTTLEHEGGLYRLSATVTYVDGRRSRRVIVGSSPAELAADMSRVIAELMDSGEPLLGGRLASVSTDPFVNEVYARALDLELRGDFAQARDLFEVVVSQEPELFWARYEIALCTRNLHEYERAEQQLLELESELRDSPDLRARVSVLNALGLTYWRESKFSQANEYFLRSLDIAVSNELLADIPIIRVNLALIAESRDDLAGAREYYDAALADFARAEIEPAGWFYNNYSGLLMQSGDIGQAREYSEKAVAAFQALGQRAYEAPSLNRLAKILRLQGDVAGALERHQQALAIYRELGDARGETSVLSSMTGVHRVAGDLTRARMVADDVIRRAQDLDDSAALADALMQSAYLYSDARELSSALDEFRRAEAMYAEMADAGGMRAARRRIAAIELTFGNLDEAEAIADKLLDGGRESGNEAAIADAHALLGRIAAARGDDETAADMFESALTYARERRDTRILIDAATAAAEYALQQGQTENAAALIEEIRDIARSDHDFMRLDARVATAAGNTSRAVDVLTALRNTAGEAWNDEDEELLSSLRQ